MKQILVTGAEGFIGRRLVQILQLAGHSVVPVSSSDGDIVEPRTLVGLFEKDISFVFHLAGRTFVPDSWSDPVDFQRVNVIGTLNVLEFCKAVKIPMTYVSAYLYGIPSALPVKEISRISPNNPYALSKFMAENYCKFYAEHFDIPITIIRPFNIYGPGQKKHFLIPEVIAKVQAHQKVFLKDLTPRRDYLYLDDFVDALLLTLNHPKGYRIYNIGSGSSMSVGEIVEIVQTVIGIFQPVISEMLPRQNEIPDVYADISRAISDLNWTPHYSFKEGIMKMIEN